MIVICPKCHYENRAETSHVVCARCATLVEVKSGQETGNSNIFELSERVTRPVSGFPTMPAPVNGTGRRDPYATRIEPEGDEVLEIPRYGNGIYQVNEGGNVFDEVFPSMPTPPPAQQSPSAGISSEAAYTVSHESLWPEAPEVENPHVYDDMRGSAGNTQSFSSQPTSYMGSVAPAPPFPESAASTSWSDIPASVPQGGYQDYVEGNLGESARNGWPVLPEDSAAGVSPDVAGPLFGQDQPARRSLMLPVLLTVLVFAGLGAAAWFLLGPRFAEKQENVAKVNPAVPAAPKSVNPAAGNTAGATGSGTSGNANAAPGSATAAKPANGTAPTAGASPAGTTATGTTKPGITTPDNKNTTTAKPAETKPAAQPETKPATGGNKTPIPVPVPPAASQGSGTLAVQVGSFSNPNEANLRVSDLKKSGIDARVIKTDIPGRGTWYRVQMGRFNTRDEASRYAAQIRSRGAIREFMIIGYQGN
ncbi:MAG: SPOR domain-containing protein [Blastocatellia bacterium]